MDKNHKPNYSPEELRLSKLRFFSMGIVAHNKPIKDKKGVYEKTIEVTPIEELTMLDGEVSTEKTDIVGKATKSNGQAYESTVTSTVSIPATWLSLGGSNRFTAPDVRRGEMVMIYQFANANKYYWTTLKDDCRLRKLETVIYAFSATRDESKGTTEETMYFMEVSTHKKTVRLHTCKADGEPFAYDIELNTKEGFFTITDDVGNYFCLDSAARQLTMKNIDGSMFDITKTDIVIEATNSVTIRTKTLTEESNSHNVKASDYVADVKNASIAGSGAVTIVSSNTTVN